MVREVANAKDIKMIVDKTVSTIEETKNEIYGIVESARTEVERIKIELKEINEKTTEIIREVDQLEGLDKAMRKKLVVVSKDFKNYSENDIKNAYEKASEIRIKYFSKQEEDQEQI